MSVTSQWQRSDNGTNWSDLIGETGATHVVTNDDLGSDLRLVETFDKSGYAELVKTVVVEVPAPGVVTNAAARSWVRRPSGCS